MADYGTFSALVDEVVTLTGRINMRDRITQYARQTIRECQCAQAIKPADDLIEDTLVTNATPYIWPKPQYFREFDAIEYPSLFDSRGLVFKPRQRQPGQSHDDTDYFYYISGDSVIFSDLDVGTTINIAYYIWSRSFVYTLAEADREARFDLATNAWIYKTAATPEAQLAARESVSNWLLFNWFDMLLEGTCAKIWKALNDQRSVSSFALYKSLQNDFVIAKTSDSYSS